MDFFLHTSYSLMCACVLVRSMWVCICVSGVGVSPNIIHNWSASISLCGYIIRMQCRRHWGSDVSIAHSCSRKLFIWKYRRSLLRRSFTSMPAPLVRFTLVSGWSRPARLVAHRAAITKFFAWLHKNLSARNFTWPTMLDTFIVPMRI